MLNFLVSLNNIFVDNLGGSLYIIIITLERWLFCFFSKSYIFYFFLTLVHRIGPPVKGLMKWVQWAFLAYVWSQKLVVFYHYLH